MKFLTVCILTWAIVFFSISLISTESYSSDAIIASDRCSYALCQVDQDCVQIYGGKCGKCKILFLVELPVY